MSTKPNKLCLCGERHDGIDNEPECPVHGRNEQPEQTGETAPDGSLYQHGPDDSHKPRGIDDPEFEEPEYTRLKAQMDAMKERESEKNFAELAKNYTDALECIGRLKAQRDAALAELAEIEARCKTASAELAAERKRREEAEKHIQLAGGYHERTAREIEIESALEDWLEDDWSSEDHAIRELLDIIDAGRNRLFASESELSALKAKLTDAKESIVREQKTTDLMHNALREAKRELATLRAEMAEAKADSERLDWMEANPEVLRKCTWLNVHVGRCFSFSMHGGETVEECAVPLRAALDSARKGASNG